ncbi:energy-coupled thiamine transporter ThiT [Planococcus sp. APC 3906]|uniref:energy-coupled thiamine transporter ThiT n=1 Tax=Planococcus sp. APC 3906 TaxID=3035194 RepID=UPI0025B4A3C6|nr:energy-coupled thiamine transporter ThiT [Planococcus sp. APC 3906]MDN3450835.1 energy-coupled thiamine transporter ThiT [Planococcus sp. APC 3906]
MRNLRVILMVEIAIFGALGFVLDFIAFKMPQGGSVSLVMIPIVLMAFRRGVLAGVLTGVLVGLLQIVTGTVSVTPLSFGYVVLQVILDYLAAYGVVGLAGIMRGKYLNAKRPAQMVSAIVAGVLIGSLLRYLMHVVTGILFFGMFAEGNVLVYSAVYNATYMIPVFLLAAFVCSALFAAAPKLVHANQ